MRRMESAQHDGSAGRRGPGGSGPWRMRREPRAMPTGDGESAVVVHDDAIAQLAARLDLGLPGTSPCACDVTWGVVMHFHVPGSTRFSHIDLAQTTVAGPAGAAEKASDRIFYTALSSTA